MNHIFISYSKKNIAFARHLRHLLQDEHFAVRMDETELIPSEKWWPTIEATIVSCAAFIVIMTPEAKESDWVEREILLAEREKKHILPVLLLGEVWPRLANIQYQNFTHGLETTLSPRFVQLLSQIVPRSDIQEVPPQLPAQTLVNSNKAAPVEQLHDKKDRDKRVSHVSSRVSVWIAIAFVVVGIVVLLPIFRPPISIPVSRFAPDVTSGIAPLTVQFVDQSSGQINSYNWDFGDGSPLSVEQNPRHVYKQAGQYYVTLKVSNSVDSNTSAPQTITIEAAYITPIATFTTGFSSTKVPSPTGNIVFMTNCDSNEIEIATIDTNTSNTHIVT